MERVEASLRIGHQRHCGKRLQRLRFIDEKGAGDRVRRDPAILEGSRAQGGAFDQLNPSAENMAKVVWEELESQVRPHGLEVRAVTVWETETTSATYRPSSAGLGT